MLTTIFSSIVDELTPLNAFLIIGASLLLGLLISLTYLLTHQKEGYTPSFPVTLIMLPAIIAVIILLVGNNVARSAWPVRSPSFVFVVRRAIRRISPMCFSLLAWGLRAAWAISAMQCFLR